MKKMCLLMFGGLFLALTGCNKKAYIAENLDFEPFVVCEQPTNAIYKNSPVRMKLKINGGNQNVLNDLAVAYSIKDGDGYILVDSEEVSPGVEFKPTNLEDSAMPFYYMPAQSGAQTLVFNVRSAQVSRTTSFDVMVEEVYYKVVIENLPADPKLGRKESFDIVINFADEEESPIKTCKVTAAIIKGAGKVEYKGAELSTEKVDMTLGRNTISYTSSLRGENIIQLNLEADNGYVQPVYIPIMIGAPDFSLSLVKEDNPSITAGKDYSFTLELIEDGQDPTNEYKITYRYIQNGGSLKINNNELEPGESLGIHSGSNVIVYQAAEGGNADIEFIVKDNYNTERKINAQLHVAFGKIMVETTQTQTITEYASSPLDLLIIQAGYTGRYSVSCTLIEGNATFTWNGQEYSMDGSWVENFSRSETLMIKPTKLGKLQFRIKVKDENQEMGDPIVVTYTINAQAPIEIVSDALPAQTTTYIRYPFSFEVTAGDAESFSIFVTPNSSTFGALFVDPVWDEKPGSYGQPPLISGFEVKEEPTMITAGKHNFVYWTSRAEGVQTFTVTITNGLQSKSIRYTTYTNGR